jgi:hypothetical protein
MYMSHLMYYCKYCSFFLAKEISGYHGEYIHTMVLTLREYFEIHTMGYFKYRDVQFTSILMNTSCDASNIIVS